MQWNVFRSHIAYLSKADITRVSKAFELGAELHKDQKRRSGQLYFTHPIAVAHKLADYHADADTIIAALLHDTVEDTPITLSEIHDQFNGSVAELIDGVTKLTPEDVQGNPALDDNIETLRKLFTYLEKDVRIVIIKLADRLHNMQTVEHLSEKRQISYAQETLDVYVKIADQLSMRDLRDELENLCLSILKPDLCEKLHALDAENERLGKQIIKRITTTLDKEGVLDNKQIHFEYKSWQS